MKHNPLYVAPLILLVVGLLVATLAFVINQFLTVPDFIKGTLAGVGIGLEIVAVARIAKLKKTKGPVIFK